MQKKSKLILIIESLNYTKPTNLNFDQQLNYLSYHKLLMDQIKKSQRDQFLTLTSINKLKEQNKVKKDVFTTAESNTQQEKMHSYYCALCGENVLITNSQLERHKTRKMDGAISINLATTFVWINMAKQRVKFVKRQGGIQPQYRWKCQQCGVLLAYSAISHEQFQLYRKNQQANMSNKPYLYLIPQSLITNLKHAKLFQQLSIYKQTLIKQIKKKQQQLKILK